MKVSSSHPLQWDSQMRVAMEEHLYLANLKQTRWSLLSLSRRWVPPSRESYQQQLHHQPL